MISFVFRIGSSRPEFVFNVLRRFSAKTSVEIRNSFLDYFCSKGHVKIPSASVLARGTGNDFVCAGVQQFRDVVIGQKEPPERRVVNSQKCIRLGGANMGDLEFVGRDNYHHSFFEMLGNWSFGDYYKEEACTFAWEFLTDVLRIDKERLYVTYFNGSKDGRLDPDLETREIWLRIGVPDRRVIGFGEEHNFWQIGEAGPCGPCTEIHIDKRRGGLDERQPIPEMVNADNAELVELWNIVFMEKNKLPNGIFAPLPMRNIDTGMGLERLCSVMQDCDSAYETDLFQPLINKLSNLSEHNYIYKGRVGIEEDLDGIDTAFRIVADHMRTVVVSLSEGIRITGSKKYERKIKNLFKRAALNAHEKLGVNKMALAELVPVVVEKLGSTYPEMQKHERTICNAVMTEEKRLWRQRDEGILQMEGMLKNLPEGCRIFPGKFALLLINTHRIELEFIREKLAKHGFTLDEEEFQILWKEKMQNYAPGDRTLKRKELEFGR